MRDIVVAAEAGDSIGMTAVHQRLVSVEQVRCSVLQCVAACCSVLQRVAACCRVWRDQIGMTDVHQRSICVEQVRCSVLQCVAACCSVLQRVAAWLNSLVAACCSVSDSMLQIVAVFFSVLQSVDVLV